MKSFPRVCGTKRKLEPDGRSHWTERGVEVCGSRWWGQRETLLQLSLLKLHTPSGPSEPGLMRRVLITNTLRHLQEQHHPGYVAGLELDTIPLDSAGLRHSDTLIQPVSATSFPCDLDDVDDFCFTELDDFLFERSSSPTAQLVKSVTETSQDSTNLPLNLELNEHDHVMELLFGSRI